MSIFIKSFINENRTVRLQLYSYFIVREFIIVSHTFDLPSYEE